MIQKRTEGSESRYHEQFELVRVVEEARDLRRLVFDRPLKSEPGQFVMMWIPESGEKPFSVMNDDPLELVVKRRGGAFTEKAFRLYPGQRVFVRGPCGNSFMPFVKEEGAKLLVCGGCGAVPLDFLARRLGKKDVKVLMGAKCREELPAFFRGRDTVTATDDGSSGMKGMATEFISTLNPGRHDQFFICGPEAMMLAAAEKAERHVPAESIILSMERYMKCGRGLCGSCELDGFRVCVDGPVFTFRQLKGGDLGRMKRARSGRKVHV